MITPQVAGFINEMRSAPVDWGLVTYAGAMHSFPAAEAGSDKTRGMACNALVDARSWPRFRGFLEEILR